MLIKIDDSVMKYLKVNISNLDQDSEEIISIVNLARSHREGNHIIIGTFNTLDYLNKLEIFDYYTARVFNYLASNFSIIGSLEYQVTDYIIVKSDEHSFMRKEENGRIIFEIPLKYFMKNELLHRTKILCEDLSDYHFFNGITQKYLSEYNLNLEISNLAVNGGGNNAYQSYEYNITHNFMVIAIVDSDKKFPESNYGQTFKNLEAVFLKYKKENVTDLLVLSVREKENLIPPSIYQISSNNSFKDAIEKLKLLESHPTHSEKLKYFDYKEGLTKDKIEHHYFRELFEVEQLISCTVDDLENLKSKDVLIKGLGSNPTKDFISKVLGNDLEIILETKKGIPGIDTSVITDLERKIEMRDKFFSLLPKDISDEINGICKKIISWSICFKVQSTV